MFKAILCIIGILCAALLSCLLFRDSLLKLVAPPLVAHYLNASVDFEIEAFDANELFLSSVRIEKELDGKIVEVILPDAKLRYDLYPNSLNALSFTKLILNLNTAGESQGFELAGGNVIFLNNVWTQLQIGLSLDSANLNGQRIEAVKGEVELQEDKVDFDFSGRSAQPLATLKLSGNYETKKGNLFVKIVDLKVDAKSLYPLAASYQRDLPKITIIDGSLSANGSLSLHDGELSNSAIGLSFTDLSMAIEGIELKGASGDFKVYQGKSEALSLKIKSISSHGLVFSNLAAKGYIDLIDKARLRVGSAAVDFMEGRISTNSFVLDPKKPNVQLLLKLTNLNIAKLLEHYPQEKVAASGKVSAALPLTIKDNQVLVRGGTVYSIAPGGVIKLHKDDTGLGSASQLDFALNAFENYHYDSFAGTVSYNQKLKGDLDFDLQFEGRNPDFMKGRALHLNLSLQENVPALLKSLELKENFENIAID